jgi:hypothetical protein
MFSNPARRSIAVVRLSDAIRDAPEIHGGERVGNETIIRYFGAFLRFGKRPTD